MPLILIYIAKQRDVPTILSITHARKELTKFFERYNARRSHQGLNDRTPNEVYFGTLPEARKAI